MTTHARITATGRAVAPVLILNSVMDERFGQGVAAWVEQNVGIKQRYHLAPGQQTSDLAAAAAQQALTRAALQPNDIDLIILSTDTPDQLSPSTAAVVQHKLGASKASCFGQLGQHRFKASLLPIAAAQPDRVLGNNPALFFTLLATAHYSFSPMPGTHLGLSSWTLRDDTRGQAFVFEGLVFNGPGSPGLAGFTGAPRFAIDAPNGGVSFFGFNFNHNLNFFHGPIAASGFVMTNFGHYETTKATTTNPRTLDIAGVGANLEVQYNWGTSSNDVVSLEGFYTSGDSNPGDGAYNGVFTMNTYGLPGAVCFNHKTLLLFPFTSTVNNYTGAVTDISNQGYGMTAGVLAANWDVIPNTLLLKVGTAAAWANAVSQDALASAGQGTFIGAEVNAEVKWTIRYLMTVGLHGAYLFKGDFYNGVTRVASSPWALFTTFTWYGF